ncbi:MAG: Crp/Fnr family transcriptional regulator [Deltaproteobacteria bacterium]|nr:Crp/Fnr family transcriptional regulator [Deltaproteobacteria bacterium]
MNIPEQYSDTISRSELFADIPPDMLADILDRGRRQHIKAGEILFHEGDHADRCYLVLKGRLKLSKLHGQGKEAIIHYVEAGAVIAAVAVFKGKRFPVTARAMGAAEAIGWDRDAIMELISEYAQFAINLLRFAIDRIEELQTRYLELAVEQVERRIARALLRIMRQSGRKTGEGIEIEFKISRQDLADYTGSTLYTVSRTLSNWGKRGWIKSGRQRIVIINPHALVSFSETD